MSAATRQMPTVTSHAMRESGDMRGLFSRTPMPAALASAVALGFLRELSADITAAILLDARGERLAGPPGLHAAAAALLDHAPPGLAELEGRTPAGAVFAARDAHHQIVVTTGPLALP